MSQTNFLLGFSFALITTIRTYLINNQDAEGIKLLEDEYQSLKNGVEQLFQGENKA